MASITLVCAKGPKAASEELSAVVEPPGSIPSTAEGEKKPEAGVVHTYVLTLLGG